MKKVVAVVGARPNYMKMAPILRAAQRADRAAKLRFVLVHTGQHYDERLTARVFEDLQMPVADHSLAVPPGSSIQQLGTIAARLETTLQQERPDLVLVVGDVTSTLAAALTASSLGIRVAHVEAGLRSFDRRMPEERNRVLIDQLADLLFTTEASAAANLTREGLAHRPIHLVGNVMIDSLRATLPAAQNSKLLAELGLTGENGSRRPYVLVTLHRQSNVDRHQDLQGILAALEALAQSYAVVFPLHPRVESRLTEFGLWSHVETVERRRTPIAGRIWALPPLGYVDFLGLMAKADAVLTDSGGVQEETTGLGVPCLTLRDHTERPITITHGTNRLIGSDPSAIAAAMAAIRQRQPRSELPPFWDGHAAERIVAVLEDYV